MALIQTRLELTNVVPEISKVLQRAVSPRSLSREVTKQSKSLSEVILSRLKENAPSGEKWIEEPYQIANGQTISHGRPSLRQHNITLEAGWNEPNVLPEVSENGGGSRIIIYTNAPHLKIITDGSPGADISPVNKSAISFWWFKRNRAEIRSYIDHPGFDPNPFVEETTNQSEPDIYASLERAIISALKPLRVLLSD